MGRKRRRLRQSVVLAVCSLLVVVFGVILVAPSLQSTETDMVDAELRQKMISEDNVNDLLASKGINIGESVKIRTLLRNTLPAGIFLKTFDITLNKLTVNYQLTEASGCTQEEYEQFWVLENARQIVMYNGGALFALVRNLDIIEINIEGYDYPTCIMTRDVLSAIFGQADLADLETAEDFQTVLLDSGVYDEAAAEAFLAEYPLVGEAG